MSALDFDVVPDEKKFIDPNIEDLEEEPELEDDGDYGD